MSAHGGLKALFILIFSVLVLHSKCFLLRIFVPGSDMQKYEKLLTFSKRIYIHRKCLLRVLSECLILIGSAMFDATFNLVTRVGLP